jgi:hypothetical protein
MVHYTIGYNKQRYSEPVMVAKFKSKQVNKITEELHICQSELYPDGRVYSLKISVMPEEDNIQLFGMSSLKNRVVTSSPLASTPF